MKKIIVIVTFSVALLATAYFYFSKKTGNNNKSELYIAIPANFPIAFESDNWNAFYNKIDTLQSTRNILDKDWFIGSKLNIELTKKLLEILINRTNVPILTALGNNGNEGIGILTAVEINLNTNQFEEALNKQNIKWTTYNNQSNTIYTITNFDNKYTLYLALKNKILLCSFKSIFVEESILAIEKQINHFDRTDLKNNFIVYIKPKQLNFIANYTLKPEYFNISNSFQKLIGNTALNVELFGNELLFYGNSMYSSSMLLDSIKNLKAETNENLDMLPDNISYYETLSFNDTLLHTTNYLKNSFYDQISKSYTVFIQNTYSTNLEANKGIIFKVNDEQEIFNVLKEIDSKLTLNDTQNDKEIYLGNLGKFINNLFFNADLLADSTYFTIIGNSLILSNNLNVVNNFIQKNNDNQLLELNERFAKFKKNSLSQSNIDFYLDMDEIRTYLNEALLDGESFSNISKFNLQLSNFGKVVYTQGKISFNSNKTIATPKELWTVTLQGNAICKPIETVNFDSQSKEILLQDDSNYLYQISKSGDILFKMHVKGKIQGEIYQIDYYNNKKLQYVFNTENKIYVVDRNGELVDGFPIELPSEASNSIFVTQYQDNKNIRYFIACNNGNIYGYESNGKPLAGWSPLQIDGVVNQPINRVVVSNKDYIYFTTNKGVFSALSRDGSDRFNKVNTISKNNFVYENEQFIGGVNGKVYHIDMSGKLTLKVILDESYQFFRLVKSINENKEAYAFANKNTFKLQLSQLKNLCSFTTDEEIRKIDSFVYQNKLWFLIYTSNKVFMIDETGTLQPDFPIETKNEIGVYNLIDGKDKVIVYTNANKLVVKEIRWTNL